MPTSTGSEDRDLGEAVAETVRAAAGHGAQLRIVGGDTKAFLGRAIEGEPLAMSGHRGVTAYEPSELVITARAGTPLAEIERLLAQSGQRLAFEPPRLGPASTIGGVVAAGLAGPRRPFAGTVRDHLLGVTIVDGQGRRLRFGGTVFKNVAGFDAFRPMAGALGTLGVLLDVSLRVTPRPTSEERRSLEVTWLGAARRLATLTSRALPLDGAFHDGERLHLRFCGAQSAVTAAAGEVGGEASDPAPWEALRDLRLGVAAAPRLWRLSVPAAAPAGDIAGRWLYDWAGAQRWLETDDEPERIRAWAAARGGHASLFRGARPNEAVFTPLAPAVLALHKRLKAVFDPAGVLNRGRLYEDL